MKEILGLVLLGVLIAFWMQSCVEFGRFKERHGVKEWYEKAEQQPAPKATPQIRYASDLPQCGPGVPAPCRFGTGS